MTPGLNHCDNVVIVPHIASASLWTRSGMVSLRNTVLARQFLHVTVLLTVGSHPTDCAVIVIKQTSLCQGVAVLLYGLAMLTCARIVSKELCLLMVLTLRA